MKVTGTFIVTLVALAVVLPVCVPAQTIGLQDRLPVDPQVEVGKFENGLTYYIRHNEKPENRAELRLVVNVGSVLEDEDQLGLAHFAEHMAFNGTKNFKKQELVNYLESIGMRFGPEVNAFTSFDETVYILQLPTDSAGVVEKGFQVLEDWAHLVSFDDEEIDKERGVIIEEWRLGRGANARMLDKQLPIMFKGSRYAERLPIGKKEVLESFPHEALTRFYKDWYRPDLMAVIAVGDFDVDHIRSLIREHFASIPSPKKEKKRVVYPVPDHKETLFALASDKEAMMNNVSVYVKLPVREETVVADYRRGMVESLFNTMLQNRLSEISKKPDAPFLMAFCGSGQFVRSKEVFVLAALAKENQVESSLQVILTEAKRVRSHGFTESEIEREKKSTMRSMERMLSERDKWESNRFASEYIRAFLTDEPIPGIQYEYDLYEQFLPGITLEEVNKIAAEGTTTENRVVAISTPEKESVPLPTEDGLKTVLAAVMSSNVQPYVDEALAAELVPNPPSPSGIASTNEIKEIGVTEWTLKNGIRVILKPTDFKNDEVRFSAFSYGGQSLVPDSVLVAAETATPIIVEGGVGQFNRIQLQKKLADKIAGVSPYISGISEGMTGQASPKDLEVLFQLIYLYFTSPRADTAAFQVTKNRYETIYRNRTASPDAAFFDTLSAVMTQHHPRFRTMTLDRLSEMNFEASLRVYHDRFANPADFTFLFVGAFNSEMIKPLVEQYLGGLKTQKGHETWGTVTYQYPTGVIEREVFKGVEPKSQVALVFTGPFEWNGHNKLVADAMLDVLDIRLRERIREDLGGTYGVSVGGLYAHQPIERYRMTIRFGCDPERVDELSKEVFVQIDSLRTVGTTNEYLNKVKEMYLRQRETNLKENGFWINTLEFSYFHGLDPREILDYPNQVERLTLDDIRQAAHRYLDPDRYVRVVLYPEQAKAGRNNE